MLLKISVGILILTHTLFSQLTAKLITEDLNDPLYVTNYPQSTKELLIVEQKGVIKMIHTDETDKKIFLDIKHRVHQPLYPADEMGFLGLEFDPNYENNGFFYVNYVDRDDFTIISRFITKDKVGDPDSEEILLKFKQPYPNHNGGCLAFGPDGYLYIAVGDGGSAGDPENRAQNINNIFGSILRIDVQTTDGYIIPKDNPFVGIDNAKSEIWAFGLRNPWRFTFDRKTGDLYIGDVGQNKWEEIHFEPYNSSGGKNYGWNILEGTKCYPEDEECSSSGTVLPVFEYPNDANYVKTLLGIKQLNMHGCSVTGGYVYRGTNIPELYGHYIFGDYCTGKVWSFILKDDLVMDIIDHTEELLLSMNKKSFYLSSFGEDMNGELYLVDYAGSIYSITK